MADSDAGSAQLLRFDDRTMMYEGDAKTGKPRCTGMAINSPLDSLRYVSTGHPTPGG